MMEKNQAIRDLMNEGNYPEACSRLTIQLETDPNDAETLYLMGLCNAHLGMDPEMIEPFLQKSLKICPTAAAMSELGIIRIKQGRPQKAASWFRKAKELDPDNANIHVNLGSALAKLGRFRGASGCYDDALQALARAQARNLATIAALVPECLEMPPRKITGTLWIGYARAGGEFLCEHLPEIVAIKWPRKPGRNPKSEAPGHFWKDYQPKKTLLNRTPPFTRRFLPNYYNVFCTLLLTTNYAHILALKAHVKMQLRSKECIPLANEAAEFGSLVQESA